MTGNILGTGICFLCGSRRLHPRKYLRLDSESLVRNLAYAMPPLAAKILGSLNSRFRDAYLPVSINKKYFAGYASYCLDCSTGAAVPMFSQKELDRYYAEFYWKNRDAKDGGHVPMADRPHPQQQKLAENRLEWINRHASLSGSAIDLGAGDCAATFELLASGMNVWVVDPSERSRALASRYGARYSETLQDCPAADFLFSSHQIEHVADLAKEFGMLVEHVTDRGLLFFETPNIGDMAVFEGLNHTPHTYMLSAQTFEILASRHSLEVVAVEACGPEWGRNHPQVRSGHRADLRILLRKLPRKEPAAP